MRCILGEGMPYYKNPFEKGRLIVIFDVEFPTDHWLPPHKLVELENLLPPRKEYIIPDGAEDCMMMKLDPNDRHQNGAYRGEAYESDEESSGPHGGPGVQCATQ